jgi:hypothetical protein
MLIMIKVIVVILSIIILIAIKPSLILRSIFSKAKRKTFLSKSFKFSISSTC